MSPFREYPDAFDEAVDSPPREHASKSGANGRNGNESWRDGANKQANNGRRPNLSPTALLPLSRLVLSFCPTR
jgi:hypothetical protein